MTTAFTILAIDPGTLRHGWALVQSTDRGRVTYVGSGHDDAATVDDRIRTAGASLVAIERPAFIPAKAMAGQALLETAEWAGVFRGACIAGGVPVAMMTAAAWRLALCRTNHPSDATVKRAVSVFVDGLPKRTNCHERDAMGLAIVAAWNRTRKVA